MTTTLDARGTLSIDDRVVERLAAHAVREAGDVGGDRAKVRARITGDTAALDVRLAIVYPAPVARTAHRAREHLRARVAELTGLSVTRVDITVTALPSAAPERRRVT